MLQTDRDEKQLKRLRVTDRHEKQLYLPCVTGGQTCIYLNVNKKRKIFFE